MTKWRSCPIDQSAHNFNDQIIEIPLYLFAAIATVYAENIKAELTNLTAILFNEVGNKVLGENFIRSHPY